MTTRDFSSRKFEIFPPSGSPPELNWISKYFPYWIKAIFLVPELDEMKLKRELYGLSFWHLAA